MWTTLDGGFFPDSKVHGANMGLIWGRQDPGGPHVGPMNLAIWVVSLYNEELEFTLKFDRRHDKIKCRMDSRGAVNDNKVGVVVTLGYSA